VHEVFDSERKGKEMNTTIRGHNLKVLAAMVLLALVLLSAIVFAVWMTAKVTDRPGNPEIHGTSGGGQIITQDLYIDRHAEVIARYHEGSLR
jgi:hypothetical protein